MQCQNAQEQFSDYLTDTLDRAHSVSLENHLATCAACKEEVTALRGVWSALDTLPSVEPPQFFHENIMSRIAQEAEAAAQPKGFDWRVLFRPRTLGIAAAAAALIMVAFASIMPAQVASLIPFVRQQYATPLEMQTQRAVWTKTDAGGDLDLTLRAAPLVTTGTKPNLLRVRIMQNGQEVKQAIVTSDSDTHLKIALPSADALSITLSDAANDSAKNSTSIPLKISP